MNERSWIQLLVKIGQIVHAIVLSSSSSIIQYRCKNVERSGRLWQSCVCVCLWYEHHSLILQICERLMLIGSHLACSAHLCELH